MSLAQLLQSYSSDITARENHNNEIGERNATAKAASIEDEFQKHLESMSSGAVDLGAAASAYHMGRNLYKKYKQGDKVVQSIKDLKDSLTNQNKPTGEEGETGGQSHAGQEPHDTNQDRGGNEAEREPAPAEEQAGEGDIQPRLGQEPNASDLDARVDDVQSRARALRQRVEAQRQRLDAPQEQPTPSENVRSAVREDTPSGDVMAPKPEDDTGGTASADAPATGDTSVAPTSEPTPQQRALPQGDTGLEPVQPENMGREGTALRPSGGEVSSNANRNTAGNTGEQSRVQETNLDDAGDVRAAQLGEQRGAATGTELESGINEADRSVGALSRAGAAVSDTVNGIKTSVGNMADNVASKVGGAVKSVLPESLGDFGTEAAISAGLDAIPVVGEVASVITGLVSLFEGLDHDSKPKEQAPVQQPVQVASGLDTTALLKGQEQQTSATIV